VGKYFSEVWHFVTGLYYDIQEIIPSVRGDYRVNRANVQLSKFNSKEIEVRALIEGQFLGKRAYVEDLGFTSGKWSGDGFLCSTKLPCCLFLDLAALNQMHHQFGHVR
jgi:hypothetical protein